MAGFDVSIVACPDYAAEHVSAALREAIDAVGGLDWVTPGMKIGVKVNLVARMKPETGATTHPALVSALCSMLAARGAEVIVGDSPGGPWSAAWVNGIYSVTGMRAVEETGAKLNRDFSQTEARFPEGKIVKQFPLTSWLTECDAVIDFCKLKTHAMAGMTCAVKTSSASSPGRKSRSFTICTRSARTSATCWRI